MESGGIKELVLRVGTKLAISWSEAPKFCLPKRRQSRRNVLSIPVPDTLAIPGRGCSLQPVCISASQPVQEALQWVSFLNVSAAAAGKKGMTCMPLK